MPEHLAGWYGGICRTSINNRILRQLVGVSVILLACCTQKIAPYNSDVAKDIESLLKKVDTVYYEMGAALSDVQANPHSTDAQKALKFSNFRKEWGDILSDSEVLVAASCAESNNEDVCATARGLLADLSKFDANLESQGITGVGQPALGISQKEMRDRLELMLHDENYKQNVGSAGGLGSSSSNSGSTKSKSGGS
jgi:hypothetical protein